MAVLEPQLTVLPEVNSNGLMHMAGFFPSVPLQVNFDLIFAPGNGRWQPLGISINVGQATPSAPPAPAAEQQKPAPAEDSAHPPGHPPRTPKK